VTRKPAAGWILPAVAEKIIYVVTDTVDWPPSLCTHEVLVCNATHVVTKIAPSDGISVMHQVAGCGRAAVTARQWTHFTPAAAWAHYIERVESTIEDLRNEIETRERYLKTALTEHARVGPSGVPL